MSSFDDMWETTNIEVKLSGHELLNKKKNRFMYISKADRFVTVKSAKLYIKALIKEFGGKFEWDEDDEQMIKLPHNSRIFANYSIRKIFKRIPPSEKLRTLIHLVKDPIIVMPKPIPKPSRSTRVSVRQLARMAGITAKKARYKLRKAGIKRKHGAWLFRPEEVDEHLAILTYKGVFDK